MVPRTSLARRTKITTVMSGVILLTCIHLAESARWQSALQFKLHRDDNRTPEGNWRHNANASILQQANSGTRWPMRLPANTVIVVSKDGTGNYTAVQEAIDSVPDDNPAEVTIQVNSGTYVEKVTVASNKPHITIQGAGRMVTTISWGDTSSSAGSTFASASVAVDAANFTAHSITFKNSAPKPPPGAEGEQAVALRISGDMAAFYSCGFLGEQDTLYDFWGRHYFKDCYIEGEIDFVFGNGQSLYKDSVINSTATTSGSVTADGRTNNTQTTGYSFVDCSIVGTGSIVLGRAWRPYSRVVFSNTYMSNIIQAVGWDDLGDTANDATVFYGEYNNTGPGANMTGRVNYAKALTQAQAKPFMDISFIDGSDWLKET